MNTRNVEAFLKRTAIAHRQNLALFLESGRYAIVVFLKTLRHCEYCEKIDTKPNKWVREWVSPCERILAVRKPGQILQHVSNTIWNRMTIRESSFFTGDTGKLRMLNRKKSPAHTQVHYHWSHIFVFECSRAWATHSLAELGVRQRAKG